MLCEGDALLIAVAVVAGSGSSSSACLLVHFGARKSYCICSQLANQGHKLCTGQVLRCFESSLLERCCKLRLCWLRLSMQREMIQVA